VALQIANPKVVTKVEALARATGLSKTAAVERAVDDCLRSIEASNAAASTDRFTALLAQLDRIADRVDAHDPLNWDETGLPT
jgi:antitoxin VapB